MHHVREPHFRNGNGERLDFAGPERRDAVSDSGQRETADAVKKTAKRQLSAHLIAAAMDFVVSTMVRVA